MDQVVDYQLSANVGGKVGACNPLEARLKPEKPDFLSEQVATVAAGRLKISFRFSLDCIPNTDIPSSKDTCTSSATGASSTPAAFSTARPDRMVPKGEAENCTAWTPCQMGFYTQTPGTAVTDVACAPCPLGSFVVPGDRATSCTPHTTCVPGTRVDQLGSATAQQTCTACGEGTFTTTANAQYCSSAGPCQAGQYRLSAGNVSSGIVCLPCPEGTYSQSENQASCEEIQPCAAGSYPAVSANASSPQECAACPHGQFTASSGHAPCKPWRDCAAMGAATSGTATTDQQCNQCGPGMRLQGAACESCPAGTFTISQNQLSCSTPRECGGKSKDGKSPDQDDFAVAAPTSTSNRMCSADRRLMVCRKTPPPPI